MLCYSLWKCYKLSPFIFGLFLCWFTDFYVCIAVARQCVENSSIIYFFAWQWLIQCSFYRRIFCVCKQSTEITKLRFLYDFDCRSWYYKMNRMFILEDWIFFLRTDFNSSLRTKSTHPFSCELNFLVAIHGGEFQAVDNKKILNVCNFVSH